MANNSLVNFRANRQFQGLLEALTISLPDNQVLQEQLTGLITKKSSYIKRLQILWDNRTKPDLTEQDIREINLSFQPTQPENEINQVEGEVLVFNLWILEIGY